MGATLVDCVIVIVVVYVIGAQTHFRHPSFPLLRIQSESTQLCRGYPPILEHTKIEVHLLYFIYVLEGEYAFTSSTYDKFLKLRDIFGHSGN